MDLLRLYACRVLDRARERLGSQLPDDFADILNLADQDIRAENGGERHYLAKTLERELIETARRNVAIRQAWRANEPITVIASRHGLSRMMVYTIVRGEL